MNFFYFDCVEADSDCVDSDHSALQPSTVNPLTNSAVGQAK